MIVEVPFHYTMSVLMPKARKPIEVCIRDTHPIEIPEVEGGDLVARYKTYTTGDLPLESWFHEGRFWSPCTVVSDDGTMRFLDAAEYAEGLRDREETGPGPSLFWKNEPYNKRAFDSVEAVGARSISSSDRDEVVAEIDKEASGLLALNGRLMVSSSEPVLRANRDSYNHQGRVHHYIAVSCDTLEDMRQRYGIRFIWRLDEYDSMIETIIASAPHLLTAPEKEAPEVLRPDLLSWDRERELLWEHLDGDLASRAGQKEALVEATVDEFVAYAALRDFLRRADRSSDEDAFEAGRLMMELRRIVSDPDEQWQPFDTAAAVYEEFANHRLSRTHPDAIDALDGISI